MTEFTEHEQQQIRDGLKTSHRVLIEPQPLEFIEAIRDIPETNRWWGAIIVQDDWGHHFENPGSDYGQEWEAPYMPGDRIHCDGGDVIVGDVWVQQLKDLTPKNAVADGYFPSKGSPYAERSVLHAAGRLCGGPYPRGIFMWHWNERYPSNPFATNPWVFVYDKLTWEPNK